MFSGTHYGIKVDMGWLKDDVDGLKQVVDFLNKDNIKFVLLPVANQRFKIDVDRVGGGFRRRPLTPPCIPFGTRRFFSFHTLLDNSRAWMCILAWLLLIL